MNKLCYGLISKVNFPLKNRNLIHTSRILKSDVQPSKDASPKQSEKLEDLNLLKVGRREKFMLVWAGKYKHVRDVPPFLNQSVLERARNKARVKINILMGVATLFGCIIMVYLGKRDVSRGENLNTVSEKFRKDLYENYQSKKD